MESAIVGFLGAAFGAIVGAWATIRSERRRERREDRFRFSEENKALFDAFLIACSDRAWAVRRQVEAAWEWSQSRKPEDEIPRLVENDPARLALERIENAIPKRRVANGAAKLLFMATEALDFFSYRAGRPPIDPSNEPRWLDQWARYEEARKFLQETSQIEVGAAPPRERPLRKRISDRIRRK